MQLYFIYSVCHVHLAAIAILNYFTYFVTLLFCTTIHHFLLIVFIINFKTLNFFREIYFLSLFITNIYIFRKKKNTIISHHLLPNFLFIRVDFTYFHFPISYFFPYYDLVHLNFTDNLIIYLTIYKTIIYGLRSTIFRLSIIK